MYFIVIWSYKSECVKHPTDSQLALESSVFYVICTVMASAPAWLVEAATESGRAKESFQSRKKKAAQ